MACNARCAFCNYWKEEAFENTSESVFQFLKRMNPVLITISGGEPFLREDLPEYVEKIKKAVPRSYVSLISNFSLADMNKIKKLHQSGVSQLCVSLDYAHAFHEKMRKLPGVFSKMEELIPQISKKYFDRVTLNTIIMDFNLDELIPLAYLAKKWGAYINYSSYYSGKNGNKKGMVSEKNREKLESILKELKVLKRKLKNMTTSDYFFDNLPSYFRGEAILKCQAGLSWVQVTPEGRVKRCSEKKPVFDHKDYGLGENFFEPTQCTECWMSCRAEIGAPMNMGRVRDLLL